MNILITGGAGFIGSHIADALLQQQEQQSVTILDDLSFGHTEYIPEGAEFIEKNILEDDVDELFASKKFDVVYHCAAQKNLRLSFDEPLLDAQDNILGFINILEAARKHEVKKVVFLSSGGQMYGDTAPLPTPETVEPNVSAPYTISKYVGELYLKYYAQRYSINCSVLRLANVYGPRQDPKGEAGVIAIFLEAMKQNKPIHIFGTGQQTRDYIFVDDVVAACLSVLQDLDQKSFIAYNIGTGKETSVNELIENMQMIIGSHSSIQHMDAIPGELQRSSLSSQKFTTDYGWQPKYTLSAGLQKTGEWWNR